MISIHAQTHNFSVDGQTAELRFDIPKSVSVLQQELFEDNIAVGVFDNKETVAAWGKEIVFPNERRL